MKTISFIKNNAMMLIALATIIGFSSFKMIEAKLSSTLFQDEYWDFVGSGNPSVPDDRENPDHYTLSTESDQCNGEDEVCQVIAPADLVNDPSGNTPDFSYIVPTPNQSVLLRIQDAMSNGANETATLKDN